jgi:hypothetical protein
MSESGDYRDAIQFRRPIRYEPPIVRFAPSPTWPHPYRLCPNVPSRKQEYAAGIEQSNNLCNGWHVPDVTVRQATAAPSILERRPDYPDLPLEAIWARHLADYTLSGTDCLPVLDLGLRNAGRFPAGRGYLRSCGRF